ncbi:MAG: M23 family metallopeptidase [Gemmatimonadaceae bacterium]
MIKSLLLSFLVLVPAIGTAQGRPSVSWTPSHVVQGKVVHITVEPDSASSAGALDSTLEISGMLAEEPLHFVAGTKGRFHALGAIPIDADDSLALTIIIISKTVDNDTVTIALPVARGSYHLQKLRVAPEFGREPDSALAARIAAETDRAMAVSRAAHDSPPLWQGAFLRPRGSRITSGFGHGREFNGTVQSRHMGVDLAGSAGAPVRASNRGVVALVDRFYLGGNVVYIDHGGGLVTGYFHLRETAVAMGDTVRPGQLIGRVGSTGRVTGPHLHWIARYGSITVDPLSLIALDSPPSSRPKTKKRGSKQRQN